MLCPVVSVGTLTMDNKTTVFTIGAMVAIWVVVVHLTVWAIQGIGDILLCIGLSLL